MIKTSRDWIDLEPYVDIDSLAPHQDRIWACLAAAQPQRWTSIVGAQGNLLDQSLRELGDYATQERANPDSRYRTILDHLDAGPMTNQFFRYVKPELAHLNDCIHLYRAESYETKHLAQACTATPAAHHFKFLFDWLAAQNLFEQWGRVVFFITEPGERSLIHRDYPTNETTPTDEFIWIDLTRSKQFFIWDADSQRENPIKSRAAWFNNRKWHGSHPTNNCAWSLRIDGVFTKKFRDLLERGSA